MDVPFGALAPDRSEVSETGSLLSNPGGGKMLVADNVLPTVTGWKPHPSLFTKTTAAALAAAPRGIFVAVLDDASWVVFEFTAAGLYQLQTDYTLATIATGYACPSGYDWSAIHFGTKLLYTNTVDGLKSYDVQAGGAISSISGAGNPAYIFACANFIVALNCLDNSGNRNSKLIKTSGFNDQTNWTGDGADYQPLADGEELIAGFSVTQNQAIILQRHAVTLMTFGNATGGAQFSLYKIADGKGSVGARSCVSFNGAVYYLDTDDFYMVTPTTLPVPIGANQIVKTFLALVDQTNFALVQGSADPLEKVIRWIYKRNSDTSTTVYPVGIGFNWFLQRWFTFTVVTAYLARVSTVALTYDVATGTYDSQTIAYDDRSIAGGAPLSGALDANFKFNTFSGPSLQATLTSGIQNSPTSGKILWCTPITDALDIQVELGTEDRLADGITWQPYSTMVETGIVPLEGRGINTQFRVTIPAADVNSLGAPWSYINGIDHVRGNAGGPK